MVLSINIDHEKKYTEKLFCCFWWPIFKILNKHFILDYHIQYWPKIMGPNYLLARTHALCSALCMYFTASKYTTQPGLKIKKIDFIPNRK